MESFEIIKILSKEIFVIMALLILEKQKKYLCEIIYKEISDLLRI